MLTLASWNVNSIRSRMDQILNWISKNNVDILLFQELKCEERDFPHESFSYLKYHISGSFQKSYNGVAIFSKYPLENTIYSIPNINNKEARYIECSVLIGDSKIRIGSIYIPNGQSVGSEKFQYKLKFMQKFEHHIKNLLSNDENFIIGGDYNIAPYDIDVYDPKEFSNSIGFSIEEKTSLRRIFNLGVVDAYRINNINTKEFSWWDYRGGGWQRNHGMRIDHFLVSPRIADMLDKCYIDREVRGEEKSSDHVPVVCKINI